MNRKFFILISIFTILSLSVDATDRSYYFRHLRVEDGLAHNTVKAILQDSKGFLWFGTKGGLNRYDGYKFKTFRNDPADKTTIGSDFIYSLYEDGSDNIWIGTDEGIYIYDTHMETFRYFDLQAAGGKRITKEVTCMVPDRNGILWIGVQWDGLFKYDPRTETLSQTAYVDGSEKGLSSNGIESICVDSDNTVWIGTIAGGLNRYEPESGTIRFFNLPYFNKRNDVRAIMEDDPGSLLLGTSDNGVFRFDKTTQTISPYINDQESSVYVRSIMKPDNDNLWLGTESGLYVYHIPTGNISHMKLNFSNHYSLSDNAIYCFCKDCENGIWIGTYFGGINYLAPDHNYFDKYFPTNEPNSISGNAVREFQEDRHGILWIGTEDNGLNWFNPRTGEFRNYTPTNSGLSHNNIHGLLLDGDKLLVGYFMRGMDVIDLKDFSIRNYMATYTEDGLGDNCVFALEKISDGKYWVGTISGLFIFDMKKGSFKRVQEVGTYASIYDIMEDSCGLVWFASYSGGVFRYNPVSGEWRHYLNIPGDPSSPGNNKAISFTESSSGDIWIATEGGGISVYNPASDSFRTFTISDGLPSNTVHKILEDLSGRMWISTNSGLVMFDPTTEEFTTYKYNKGLNSNQFNYKSGIRSSDGMLYFGSIRGFLGFDPMKPLPSRPAPPVVITRFDLLNRETSPAYMDSPLRTSVIYSPDIVLKHDQSSFSLEFAALSYDASEMNQYAYRLEGLEDEWNYITFNQRVNYSKVPPGRYTFHVRGSNSNGTWNNEGASLSIRIRPPFTASVSGIILESLAGIAILFTVVRFYRRRAAQKHQRMVDRMRSMEEVALQKAKMSFFTSITHEIRTPLSLIRAPFEQICKVRIDDPQVNENLAIMGSNINRLLNLSNELLDFSKVEGSGFSIRLKVTDIGDLINNSISSFRQIQKEKGFDLQILLPREPLITCVDPEILLKIFTNLMSNASKFAAHHITIRLDDDIPSEGFFRFSISNDGNLISPANREKVFKAFFQEKKNGTSAGTGLGLPLVKQLTELHGGRIYIDTESGDENRFVVEIPKTEPQDDNSGALSEPDREFVGEEFTNAGQIHIIIAEDDASMRYFLGKSLSKWYKVTCCANGEEVLQNLGENPADLIVTDFVMPRMDGMSLCRLLKTKFEYSHIPVIMLTVMTGFEFKMEGLDSGADAYIEKPFSVEHLHIRIENLLKRIERLRQTFRSNPNTPAGTIAINVTDEAFICRMNEIILEHIENENFSIDQVAEIMNISRSNLYRKIKGISQMSPSEYIRLCRLKRAVDLMNEGNFRINEICYLVGFNSPSYFTKCFYKQFGITPKDYLKGRG